MDKTYFAYYRSPIGLVEIGGTATSVTSLNFVAKRRKKYESHPVVDEAANQTEEYFSKTRRRFDLAISLTGTDFQKKVWKKLITVPFGKTASYLDIARAVGNPKAVRAVGGANGCNPISIIVPCHRIVGSDGSLTGYGSGLWRKEWLLKHEGAL